MINHWDDWQKEILAYKGGDIGLVKGRRIGATDVFAAKAIEHLIENYNTHPSSQIVCVSLTEDQAELIIAFALRYAQQRCPHLIGKGVDRPTKTRIILNVDGNRRILLARPVGASGDSSRGFEGQILMVDEAPFHDRKFFASATPILLTTGGHIWMWGTLNNDEDDNYFWREYKQAMIEKDPDARFKFWEKTTEEVFRDRPISPTWTEKIKENSLKALDREKKTMTEAEYGREYLCKLIGDIKRWFTPQMIDQMCHLKETTKIRNKKVYFGCDLAREGEDETTHEGINKATEDEYNHIHHEVNTKVKIDATFNRIIELTLQYKPKKYGIDADGMGAGLFDFLVKHRVTRDIVTSLRNSKMALDANGEKTKKSMKEEMYTIMKMLCLQGKIHLLDRHEIRSSLASIQYEYVRKAGQETKLKITSKYGHIAEGLVRAIFEAYQDKSLQPFIRTVSRGKVF